MFKNLRNFRNVLTATVLIAAAIFSSVLTAEANWTGPALKSHVRVPAGAKPGLTPPLMQNGSSALRIVSGIVWQDTNGNGILDAGEIGLPGVTLDLIDKNGKIRDTATTAADGTYIFLSVSPGEYQIDVTNKGILVGESSVTTGNDPAVINIKAKQGATVHFGVLPLRYDLGDLPNGSQSKQPAYPTNLGDGAVHILFPDTNGDGKPESMDNQIATWLGYIVDAEPDGQASSNAKGDDLNGGDEDGVNLTGSWHTGSTDAAVEVIVSSSQPATVPVGLWIDWDFDGVFDHFYSVNQKVGGTPATVSIPVTVPAGFAPMSPVVVRVRSFDTKYSPTSADYAGAFDNGEVEDYYIMVGPTAVTLSQLHASIDWAQPWFAIFFGSLLLALTIAAMRLRSRRLALES